MRIATALKKHLLKTQKHLGRSGDEMKRLADVTGLSVHQLQSIAMKRRGVSVESGQKILAAIS